MHFAGMLHDSRLRFPHNPTHSDIYCIRSRLRTARRMIKRRKPGQNKGSKGKEA